MCPQKTKMPEIRQRRDRCFCYSMLYSCDKALLRFEANGYRDTSGASDEIARHVYSVFKGDPLRSVEHNELLQCNANLTRARIYLRRFWMLPGWFATRFGIAARVAYTWGRENALLWVIRQSASLR